MRSSLEAKVSHQLMIAGSLLVYPACYRKEELRWLIGASSVILQREKNGGEQ